MPSRTIATSRVKVGMNTPLDIGGMVGWFPVDRLTGFNDGDAVTTLTDRSGMGNHLTASGTGKPFYKVNIANGLPALLFDGVDDVMNAAYSFNQMNILNSYAYFAVFNAISVEGNNLASPYNNDCIFDEPTGDTIGLYLASSGKVQFGQFKTGPGETVINQNYTIGTNDYAIGRFDGSNLHGQTSIVADSSSASVARTTSQGLLKVANGSGTKFCNMYLMELGFYDHYLSDANATLLNNYLSAKYGIAST